MARALGMCPKCKGYWRIRDLVESKYSCLHCGYQLRVGSEVPVKSGKGKVLTPCTPDRANREVASHRAQFDAHGTLWLYDSPELHAPYRSQVFERDAGTCLWCGNPADTVDHIIPYSEGGVYHPANLMCACRHCNQKRQNDNVLLFLERLAGESTPAPYAGYIVQLYDLACGLVPLIKEAVKPTPFASS